MGNEMAEAAAAALQAEGLRKRFGDREVVKGISLELRRGEVLGLLGPNGAGKSTTVAMLCGLLQPDGGRLLIGGRAPAGDADPRKARIGLVPQDLALYEALSARQNLQTFGRLYGLTGATLAERCAAALALAGLSERAGDLVGEFSGGMKRRLNIACALLHEPEIVILDEPTVGVDPQSRNAIFETLEHLRAQGRALLYTTHYMEEAERLCQRLAIMDHGEIIASGRLDELLRGLPLAAVLTLGLLEAADTGQQRALLDLPAVQALEASQEGRELRLTLGELAELPVLLAALPALGLQPRELHTERPSLEQLFLSLTGRQLRD